MPLGREVGLGHGVLTSCAVKMHKIDCIRLRSVKIGIFPKI